MVIGEIQKTRQSKIRKGSSSLEPVYIWDADIKKCFDSMSHDWLLKNVPFLPKYKYILKSWLKSGYFEFETRFKAANATGMLQGGIISSSLMNCLLNGIEDLLGNEIVKYQKIVSKSRLKSSKKRTLYFCQIIS